MILIALYIFFLRIEKVNHEKRVKSIPLRIWVNGSRGKSSVTRLIAAGLRAGGKRVVAKTTGTQARFITDSKHEQPILRLGMPNIREQMKIFKKAVGDKPDAIVLECMALRPDLQYSEAVHIVKPTAVVVTNVRADHLDVMGPSVTDVAKNFLNALPPNSKLFISDKNIVQEQGSIMKKKNTEIYVAETEKVSDAVMSDFSYIEHKSNVAIALDVCRHFGIKEKDALAAMYEAQPDPGVLQKHNILLRGKHITIVNAMAANDPESTFLIWQMTGKEYDQVNILINCRNDRVDRTFQMANLIKDRIQGDHYILTGTGTDILARKLRNTIKRKTMLDIGGKKPEDVVNAVLDFVSDNSLIFAMGNTVGFGEEMLQHFLRGNN